MLLSSVRGCMVVCISVDKKYGQCASGVVGGAGGGGGGKPYRYVLPQRVWFLRHFGLKTGIDFALFGLESGPGGWGVLPYNRLMGMCGWMGSHFHDWIDYKGVAHFLIFRGTVDEK